MALATTSDNRMKGQTFKSWFDAYERLFGAPAKSALIDALPTEFADAVRFGALVASGWYPIRWYTDLYEQHASLKGRAPGFARKMGKITTEQDFRGIYAFIVKLASPATVFSNTQRLLKLYLQHCEAHMLERDDTHVRMRLEIPGANDDIWDEFCGGAEAILEVNGARAPSVQFVRHDGVGEMNATWLPR